MSLTTVFASDMRIDAALPDRRVARGFDAVWGACTRAPLPLVRQVRYDTRHDDGGWCILENGEEVARATFLVDVLPLLETRMYAQLRVPPAGAVLLHAGAVVRDRQVYLFVGGSGSGKSSLVLAALADGFTYVTDEIVFTDGRRLWGVPRAPQFEPTADSRPLPPRLTGLDRISYPLRQGAEPSSVPLMPLTARPVDPGPHPVERMVVVAPVPGTADVPTPLCALDALAVLHEGMLAEAPPNLGGLVRRGACARLTWRDPAAALRRLVEAQAAGAME